MSNARPTRGANGAIAGALHTAAVPASQIFVLIGVLFLLPIIIGYFVLVYWLFRGKVREGEGYH